MCYCCNEEGDDNLQPSFLCLRKKKKTTIAVVFFWGVLQRRRRRCKLSSPFSWGMLQIRYSGATKRRGVVKKKWATIAIIVFFWQGVL
jgi:hypothetical protein